MVTDDRNLALLTGQCVQQGQLQLGSALELGAYMYPAEENSSGVTYLSPFLSLSLAYFF